MTPDDIERRQFSTTRLKEVRMTPDDIERRQFSTTRLKEGYVAEEVDEFLDVVAEDYREFHRRINQLETELRNAKRAPAPYLEETAALPVVREEAPQLSAESIKSILVAAQAAADRIEADAAAEAAKTQSEADRDVERRIINARVEAEQIIAAATDAADTRIAELRIEEERLSNSVAKLTKKEAEYRDFLKGALIAFDDGLLRPQQERSGG
jgi:DivIVA domain-containing protein